MTEKDCYIIDMEKLKDATIEDFENALVQLNTGPGINEDVSEEYNDAVDLAIKLLEREIVIRKSKKKELKRKYRLKVARWMPFEYDGATFYQCSCCKETELIARLFCPNCGADMGRNWIIE